MTSWKKVIISGSDAALNSLNVTTSVTASVYSGSYIDLDVLSNGDMPPHKAGRIFFGQEDGALEVYNEEADITLQVGQEFWVRAYNKSGGTILNGTPVRASGSQGDRIGIYPALAEDHTAQTVYKNHILGVATHDIGISEEGYVTAQGVVRGVDTSGFAAGDILYLQTGSAGFRNTPPPFPYDIVQVGYVSKIASPNGFIFVEPKEPVHFNNISGLSGSAFDVGDLWVYQSNNSFTTTKTLSGSYTIDNGDLDIDGSITGSSATFSGTVGIGTTSPTNKLHIDEGILRIENAPPDLSTVNSVRENGIRLDAGSDSNYAEIRPYNGGNNTVIGLSFWASNTTPTEVVRIQPNGDVGIGNSNPDTKLDVNGDVTITDKIIHSEDTDTFIRFSNNDEITLDAGAQNQVKITSDGSGRVEIQKQLHAGDYVNIVGTGYDLHDGVSSIIDTGEFSEETTNLFVSGDILSNQVAGESGIRPSTLVYLETDKKWYIASATSAGEVDRFLGIALNSTSLGGTLDVLISGIINYNANASQHAQLTSGAEVGAPIYASTTSGVVTEVAPSSAGNIVKVLGHNISGNGILRTAVVRFQPDNTWIEL